MGSSDTGSCGRGASEDSTVSVHECAVRVKVGEKHLEWSKVDQGVRQGSTLSPWLILDTIVKEARQLGIHGWSDIEERECGCPAFC